MKKVKDKYEFILDLLETGKLTPAQKERVMLLSTNVIKDSSQKEDEILERIKKIEDIIKGKDVSKPPTTTTDDEFPIVSKPPSIINDDDFPKQYYNPKILYQFIKAFKGDLVLKSTCHLVDSSEMTTIIKYCGTEDYNFQIHYEKIIEHFEKLKGNFKDQFVDKKLTALIQVYLKGGGNWNNRIKINWNSPDLLEWANNNPGIPPNLDDDLQEKFNIIGYEFIEFMPTFNLLPNIHIKTFGELSQYFNYLIHIRSDNSIRNICNNINKKHRWEERIDFNYENINETVDLFTNVEKLIESYQVLIKLILEVTSKNNLDKPKVILGFINIENTIVFSIHHINTTYKHTIQYAIEETPGQTYRNLILNQLNGLCEFNIEADFGGNEYANISIWNYEVWKTKKRYYNKINKTEGVKYILTFKK